MSTETPLSDEEIEEIEAGHYATCEAVEFCAKDTVSRAVASTRSLQARVAALEGALRDVTESATRWLNETGRVHVNSHVGRGRTRAAVARADALLSVPVAPEEPK